MRTRLDVSHARGFTKFVGRQSEMAALEAALEQAIAGNAQVVGVVAEPGTGKSRLCYEFAERCRAREIPVYEAHGVAHGKAVPLSADPRVLPRLLRDHRARHGAGRRATRSPGGCSCSTRRSPRGSRSCSISSACRIPSGRLRLSVPRRGSGSFST